MAFTVLVTGATGKQGSHVVASLLALPTPPTSIIALTRSPTSPASLALAQKSPSINLLQGSFSTLVTALVGVDAVFLMTDIASGGAEGELKQGREIVEGLKSHLESEGGKERKLNVVYTSVDGAERKSGVPHFESKFVIEEMLREVIGESLTILSLQAGGLYG
ncbi:hypothetical protein P7C70_g1777, partial [Phenoliferia sp. Uapishka_3]